MGKECGAWVSRRLWGGGNTSPLKTTAWEAMFMLTSFPGLFQRNFAILIEITLRTFSVVG